MTEGGRDGWLGGLVGHMTKPAQVLYRATARDALINFDYVYLSI